MSPPRLCPSTHLIAALIAAGGFMSACVGKPFTTAPAADETQGLAADSQDQETTTNAALSPGAAGTSSDTAGEGPDSTADESPEPLTTGDNDSKVVFDIDAPLIDAGVPTSSKPETDSSAVGGHDALPPELDSGVVAAGPDFASNVGDDDVTESDAGADEPDNGEPNGAEPDVAEPDVAEPSVTEPDVAATGDSMLDGPKLILGIAFDIAASMGRGTQPYYDPKLKWEPVVAGASQFFQAPESANVASTLTLFPNDKAPDNSGDEGRGGRDDTEDGEADFCVASDYVSPTVALTALPSEMLGTTLVAATPTESDAWLVGTPTLAVVEGVLENLKRLQAEYPAARVALVIVTDGTPRHCDRDMDDVDLVADTVAAAASPNAATPIATYVIGIDNPITDEDNDPPDSVSEMDVVATAGGTGSLYLIDTTDPELTADAMSTALAEIQQDALTN